MRNVFIFFFLTLNAILFAQVGIGTTTPNPSSILELESTTQAFLPPRMTNAQMQAIASPLNGSIVFNTTFDAMYLKTSVGWRNFFDISKPTLILNKEFISGNNILTTINDTYANIPIGTPEIVTIDNLTFEIVSNGKIKLKAAGIYMVTSNFSVINLPTGSKKYILSLEKNGTLYAYITRGEVNLTALGDWGCSGSLTFTGAVGDVINNSSVNVDAKILNIGITKLK
jgi:hypothetical protein